MRSIFFALLLLVAPAFAEETPERIRYRWELAAATWSQDGNTITAIVPSGTALTVTVDTVAPEPPPVVNWCAALGPDRAAKIREIWRAHAALLDAGQFSSVGIYWRVVDEQLALVPLEQFDAIAAVGAMRKRLEAAIGRDDKPLDVALRGDLVATLGDLAAECSCDPNAPPPPDPNAPTPDPVIVPGERVIVLVAESENSPFAALVNDLRTGAAGSYLNTHGHRFYLVDPDSRTADGAPDPVLEWVGSTDSPRLYLLEPKDKRPIAWREISSDETADDVLEFIKAHGG